uniref:Uncharacterized protein n=2 Tax=Oryza glumipatula TaxID=40148 RepID=A0A0E0AQB8_9ORYZ
MPSAPSNLACVKDPISLPLLPSRDREQLEISFFSTIEPFPAASVRRRRAPAPRVFFAAGECSSSQPCASSSPDAAGDVWAKLVPSDSVFPEVELAEDDAVVCSRVTPDGGGEVVAWCKIRRGGDVSAATIWNLSLDAIIVDGRVIQQEAVDIKPGSEIVPGPQKDAMAASLSGLEGLQLIRVIKVRVLPVHNRSDEEIALLESYAPVKTNILIKAIYTVRCTTRQRSVPSSASTLP